MSAVHDYEGMKIRNLVKLADKELDAEAMAELGFRYCSGYGIRPNQNKGFHWLLGAAMLDDPVAQYVVGTMCVFGKGTAVDYDDALYWFSLAAENGHADALNEIGIMFAEGMGIDADFGKAEEYWNKAVELGCEDAERNLAHLKEMKNE